MDIPPPPQDIELRNIIDKLAQFVARNGPDFEQMTKNKQKDNPKFQFLFGGEHYAYYQYKVNTEQSVLKQPPVNGNPQNGPSWNQMRLDPTPSPSDCLTLDQIAQQQEVLREQIKQSEQNLNAQHAVLMQQQQGQVETTITKCESAEVQREAENSKLNLNQFNTILQPIIDSCTKDSISNGKSWILQNAIEGQQAQCVAHCLLYKVVHGNVPFMHKLHLIYLVNDVLHHCARKNAVELKNYLEQAVVPMFCNASMMASDEQCLKLDKLLKLWESKANYMAGETVNKLRQPVASYQQFKADQLAKFAGEVAHFTQQTKATYDGYQTQHQAFVCHAMQQIMELNQQVLELQKKQTMEAQKSSVTTTDSSSNLVESSAENSFELPECEDISEDDKEDWSDDDVVVKVPPPPAPPPLLMEAPPPSNNVVANNLFPLEALQANIQQTMSQPPPVVSADEPEPQQLPPPPSLAPPPPSLSEPPDFLPPMDPSIPPPNIDCNNIPPFSQPPPGFFSPPAAAPAGIFPDFSRPPPGFALPPPEPMLDELLPTVPYYELPAGLIVPLVKLEDTSFKPLDPKDIRLPAPQPPSERLIAAVEAFYSGPTHERPRDSEGWEKLGLYEFYKAKNNAKRDKEDAIAGGARHKSRSPSPVVVPAEREASPPRRRYQSLSPTPQKRGKRSRSRSPRRTSRRRSRSRRRSSRRSTSRSKSRSRSRSPPRSSHRSPSPVASFGSSPYSKLDAAQELDSSNKGHQMLRKMGWGGSGLGAKEQGIDSPISGGDVRDRQDQFKGVGMDLNDPYENFRKNKGAAFITRMKARAEERANEA